MGFKLCKPDSYFTRRDHSPKILHPLIYSFVIYRYTEWYENSNKYNINR